MPRLPIPASVVRFAAGKTVGVVAIALASVAAAVANVFWLCASL